jgi:hypothetical protein
MQPRGDCIDTPFLLVSKSPNEAMQSTAGQRTAVLYLMRTVVVFSTGARLLPRKVIYKLSLSPS